MPQLIFLPGLACDAVMWQAQLEAVRAAIRAGWPARLNPAVSDVGARFGSLEAMAQALLDEQPGDLIVCGASMGSILALEVVRQAPSRIKGLALLGTNARPEAQAMRSLREGAIQFFEQGRALEVLTFNLPMAFHPSRVDDTALLQTYLDFVMAAGAGQLIAQNRALMARPDARPGLPQVRCPSLVMCGDSDLLTPPELARECAALLPHSELVILAQCGHMLTMERPHEVNMALLQWLKPLV